MRLFRLPKTRKKPTDIVNPYATEDYCLSDGIRQPDDFPIKQDFIYDGPPLTLMCQTDIDLGGQLPTRQSTSGYLLYIQGQLFHWRGRTEKLILTATTAGEYVALSRGNTATKHVNGILKFFGNKHHDYYLYTDNQSAEHIATQPTMSDHSRSIDLRIHSIRQDYLENMMRIGGVKSRDNISDIHKISSTGPSSQTHTPTLSQPTNTYA
jgi:hypothetical protein